MADLSELQNVAMLVDRATSNTACASAKLREELQRVAELSAIIRQMNRQTNMLALNAAMEAARAGESGLGFGVVAREVKTMASTGLTAVTDIDLRIDRAIQAAADSEKAIEELKAAVAQGLTIVQNMVMSNAEPASAYS